MSNPLKELAQMGQSVWYDQMTRSLLTEGHLRKMIEEDRLGGLTSNPTIFEKAIGGSGEYDAELARLATQGLDQKAIYETLAFEDIGGAADTFRSLHDSTDGEHGYVSLEVDPRLAHDTDGTIAEARRYFETLGRPNLMIKVPATEEGLPAIERLIADGINVNVTLIFSREVYRKVIDSYLKGLEARVDQRAPVGHIRSVASFFVSRIDTKADEAIEAKLDDLEGDKKARLEACLGQVAIANAKLAYQLFREEFGGDRFARLRDAGAHVQRPLWASTGTKNSAYSDILYVENLIGPDTVNTLPPKTYDAFRDHGRVAQTIDTGLDRAREVLSTIEDLGISLEAITDRLTVDGVAAFEKSFVSLLDTIEKRRESEVAST
ncbi:MAG: transaldolase [Thermoanaerobaculia bacterium]|nr:transaldolase [Thermoanaerobaculia bacterium]